MLRKTNFMSESLVEVNENALLRAQTIPERLPETNPGVGTFVSPVIPGSSELTNHPSFGFCTAAGKIVEVKPESLVQVRKLLETDVGEVKKSSFDLTTQIE